MVGATSFIADPNICPCLCFYSKTSCSLRIKSGGKMGLYKNLASTRKLKMVKAMNQKLTTTFLDDAWYERRLTAKIHSRIANGCSGKQKNFRNFRVVNELGGQYEEVFNDIKLQIRDSFTAKAVRTVLYQLHEMNPPDYTWFYNFVATNDPGDGKLFLRTLAKERQGLAERVMITRLHLYSKWIKVCDHAEIYKEISDENLELMRERLMETIVWPSDDSNTEKMS